MWVRNEARLNTQRSKVISKDVRAVRSDGTTQEPRRALRIARLFFEILFLCLRRTRHERKSTKNLSKIDENPPQIEEKSILGRFGRPKSFQGRVRTRSRWLLDTQMPPQRRSWGATGAPRAARSRPKTSPGRPRDAPRALGTTPKVPVSAVRIAQRSWKRLRIDFSTFSVDARQLRSAFCIAPASVLSISDVLRLERLPHAKTSKKQPFRTPKSRPGASWGPAGEQVRAPKRPSRAKKRVRSASGASENFKVSANESTSSE